MKKMHSIYGITFLLVVVTILNSGCSKKNKTLFLKGIDFSDGEYVLVINDKHKGKFWIDDEKILKKNRKNIRIKGSWVNFLPGEGDRSFGFTLLKDRKVIRSKYGAVFSVYDYGSVLKLAEPLDSIIEEVRFYDTKNEITKKFDFEKLADDKTVYNLNIPVFDPIEYNYHFRVQFPSIAVPVHFENKDTDPYWRSRDIVSNGFDREAFGKELYAKIHQNISAYTGRLRESRNKNAASGSISAIGLFNTKEKWHGDIRDADKKRLHVYEYMLEHYEIRFSSDKEFYEQIKQHDFSQYVTEQVRNRAELVNLVKEKIKQAEPAIAFEDVGFSGYRDQLKTSGGFYERKYSLRYWQKKPTK